MGPLVVIILRLLIPLIILKRPFLGAILAMALDALDVVLITILNMGNFSNYHSLDKILDMYYLSLELYVSLHWTNILAKHTSIFLFMWRVIGFIIFETLKIRWVLFIFPNLFENFFLFYVTWKKYKKTDVIKNFKTLFVILMLLLLLKLPQEHLLHIKKAQPWTWTKQNILHIER